MDHEKDDSDRLKPCPFCGGNASMGYVDRGHDAGGRYIACDACDASTGLRFACGDDPTPLLMEQWNRRTADLTNQAGLANLYGAVAQILDAGHMNTEDLARLRAAWESA